MRRKILLALFAARRRRGRCEHRVAARRREQSPLHRWGAGIGLLSGIGYASLMPGHEATLEPGDTFRVEVGTLSYRPIPSSPQLPLYPAGDPSRKNGVHQAMRDRPIRTFSLKALMFAFWSRPPWAVGPLRAPPVDVAGASSELPPAYTRDKILDPKLAEAARAFTGWVEAQKVRHGPGLLARGGAAAHADGPPVWDRGQPERDAAARDPHHRAGLVRAQAGGT